MFISIREVHLFVNWRRHLGRSQLRVVLGINAAFACLAVCAMIVEGRIAGKISPSLGIFGVSYLVNASCLALGADWARVISAGVSVVVVMASILIILMKGETNIMGFVSVGFGLVFGWSAYVLYFSKTLQAELEERRLQRQKGSARTH
jgi:hypothetical protein